MRAVTSALLTAIATSTLIGPASISRAFAEPPATRPAVSVPTAATMRHGVPALNLNRVAFADALDTIYRETLGLNLYVNWPALEAAGIDRNAPITLRLRGVAASKVLDLICQQAGGGTAAIGWYVSDGVLHITTKELAERDLVTRIYPVQDLIVDVPNFDAQGFDFAQSSNGGGSSGDGGGSLFGGNSSSNQNNGLANGAQMTMQQRGEQLADLIRTTVAPEAWVENGGYSRIRFFNGNLIVTAPRSVQLLIGR